MKTLILAAIGTTLIYLPIRALMTGSDKYLSCFMGVLFGFLFILGVITS